MKKKELQQVIASEDDELQDVEKDVKEAESEEKAQIDARQKQLDQIKEEERKLAEDKQRELHEAEERLKKHRQEVQDMLAQAAKVSQTCQGGRSECPCVYVKLFLVHISSRSFPCPSCTHRCPSLHCLTLL